MNPSTGGHLHITFCHPGLCHMGYFQVLSSSLSSALSSLLFNPYRLSLMPSSSHPAYHDHNQHNIRWSWKATMPTRPDEANEEFAAWKLWVGNNCTWLYIGSQVIVVPVPVAHIFGWDQAAWAVFVVSLYFSKFADVKLGSEESTPEYNNASWWEQF